MKIVIDISEEQYEIIKELAKKQNSFCPEADSAEKIIANGIPLPKGHGDLIDRTEVIKNIFDYCNGKKTIGQCIDNVPTIIETESEEKNEDSN